MVKDFFLPRHMSDNLVYGLIVTSSECLFLLLFDRLSAFLAEAENYSSIVTLLDIIKYLFWKKRPMNTIKIDDCAINI